MKKITLFHDYLKLRNSVRDAHPRYPLTFFAHGRKMSGPWYEQFLDFDRNRKKVITGHFSIICKETFEDISYEEIIEKATTTWGIVLRYKKVLPIR